MLTLIQNKIVSDFVNICVCQHLTVCKVLIYSKNVLALAQIFLLLHESTVLTRNTQAVDPRPRARPLPDSRLRHRVCPSRYIH